jgi:hypothetical protein
MAMSESSASVETQQTAAYLSELLARPPYRYKWLQFDPERQRTGRAHQAAVAKVLEEYVDRADEERRYVSLKSLPQRVSKAMRGEVLTRATLDLFVGAFDINPDEAGRLRRLLEGSDRIRVLSGPRAPLAEPVYGPPAGHRATSVHDHHYVDADGLPAWHRTQQVIESITDHLERYPYRFDTDALSIEVEQGGRPDGPVYDVGGGLYGVDIRLDEPLERGEQTSLIFRTEFRYAEPPPPELRRAARGRLENVAIRVEFHPDRVPGRIWWAVWDGLDGSPVSREETALRNGRYVFRQLDAIERTVVGFTWEWGPN